MGIPLLLKLRGMDCGYTSILSRDVCNFAASQVLQKSLHVQLFLLSAEPHSRMRGGPCNECEHTRACRGT